MLRALIALALVATVRVLSPVLPPLRALRARGPSRESIFVTGLPWTVYV